jgi:histidine triad (HIT) family protein
MPSNNSEAEPNLANSSLEQGCVFCGILSGERPSRIVYQDAQVTAFWDARPAAAIHILIIPNRHIASVNQLEASDEALAGHLIIAAQQIAVEKGIDLLGYRLLINNGRQAGQTIDHLHLHLLSAGLPHGIG